MKSTPLFVFLAVFYTLSLAAKQNRLKNTSVRQTTFTPRLIVCLPGCGCQTERGVSVDCPFIDVGSDVIVLRANRIAPGRFRAIRQVTFGGESASFFQEGPPTCPVVETRRPIQDLTNAICTKIPRPSPLPEAPVPPEPEEGINPSPIGAFNSCRIRVLSWFVSCVLGKNTQEHFFHLEPLHLPLLSAPAVCFPFLYRG